jgi:CheY-like chemotaxis protein
MDISIYASENVVEVPPSQTIKCLMRNKSLGRVLVVDDDPDNANSLAMLLRANKYDAQPCDHPVDCLDMIDTWHPDVVLLDLAMPGITGYEIAERLRGCDDYRSLILIALSGYGTANDLAQTRAKGFDWHLVKPVEWRDLDSVLKAALLARQNGSSKTLECHKVDMT